MDEMVYEALSRYYNTLEKTGYMSYDNAVKLLILIFLKDFVFNDYRCILDKDDYRLIERALNCLYGTTCLIPYPDYLKMGKLKLGEMTEVLSRTKAVEEYSKELDQRILDNDVLIEDNIRRLDEHGNRLDAIESTKVVKGKNHITNIPDIDLTPYDVVED